MRRRKSGFTIVELLTVMGIIAVLVGLLVPALSMVRRTAKETAQKAQLIAIDMALIAFKNDYGEYPPSDWPDFTLPPPLMLKYCGAQKLAEALLGWDLLGFHPDSAWRADGRDREGGEGTYDPARLRGDNSFNERKGHYLDLETANAFKLGISKPGRRDGLFDNTVPLDPNTFVICDSFGVRRITLGSKIVKAGTPILYYRANTSSKTIEVPNLRDRIYDARDNLRLVALKSLTTDGRPGEDHPLGKFILGDYLVFYNHRYDYGTGVGYGIRDPKVAIPWPYRPDSYILITAGADGLYGTSDDICNFGK